MNEEKLATYSGRTVVRRRKDGGSVLAAVHPGLRDIAWAAGLFEGEGFVSSASGQVQISQQDRWVLMRMLDLFGGSVCGPYAFKSAETSSNRRPISRWVAGGARATGFVLTIFTFLSPRRRAQVRDWLERS